MRGPTLPLHRLAIAATAILALVVPEVATAAGSPTRLSVSVAVETPSEPAKLEVLWDGEPREVVAVEPHGAPWRLLVYVDAPLATARGMRRALDLLASKAELLTELGEVELVVADARPRLLLPPTGDGKLLRRALAAMLDECTGTGELLWLRQRFAASPSPGPAAIAEAERAEGDLRGRQDDELAAWLEREPPRPRQLLLLIRDGYDLRPADFYRRSDDSMAPPDVLTLTAHAELERRVAGAGWTVVGLELGGSQDELSDPREALQRLAAATGGRVVGGGSALKRALQELAQRQEVVFIAHGDEAEGPRPLEVRRAGRRRALPSVRWLAAPGPTTAPLPTGAEVASSERPALRLVAPHEHSLAGTVKLHTIVATRAVERVEFHLDGELVHAAEEPPFSARIDLGDEARPCRVTARAFGLGGLPLGIDSLDLNQVRRPPGVRLTRLERNPYAAEMAVEAEVGAPPDAEVVAVEFFWNDQLHHTVETPPYSARLPVPEVSPGDYARVVARLSDGSRLEAARLAPAAGPSDRVDVNLVEIYAVVTDRRGDPQRDLDRGDFHLRRKGRSQSIEGFASELDQPLHVGLVIDSSMSMRDSLPRVRQAAARFLERVVGPSDRAFLVDFNDRPRLLQEPTSDVGALLRRLGGLQARGDTALYDSVLFSLRQFEGVGGRRALIVLTDGVDEGSRFGSKRCIREARRAGVPIYVIRIGDPVRPYEWALSMANRQLARSTGGRLETLPRGEELDRAYERIEAELRSHYLLTFSTERGLSEEQRQAIEVEVADPRLSVRTIVGVRSHG